MGPTDEGYTPPPPPVQPLDPPVPPPGFGPVPPSGYSPGAARAALLERYAWYSLVAGAAAIILAFVLGRYLIVVPFFGVYYGVRGLGSRRTVVAVIGMILSGLAVLLLLGSFTLR